MTVECPPNRFCRIYHVRQDMGPLQHWRRGSKEPLEGIATLLAEVCGVDKLLIQAFEIAVTRGEAFADDEVFGPVETLIRDMEGEPR